MGWLALHDNNGEQLVVRASSVEIVATRLTPEGVRVGANLFAEYPASPETPRLGVNESVEEVLLQLRELDEGTSTLFYDSNGPT